MKISVRRGSRSWIIVSDRDEWALAKMARKCPPARHDRALVYSATPANIRFWQAQNTHIDNVPAWNELLALADEHDRRAAGLATLAQRSEPDGFHGQLRPFQKEGLDFLCKAAPNGCLLADEMGLGKTVQALAYLQSERPFPAVVVSPLVTLENWRREISNFTDLSCRVIRSGRPKPLANQRTLYGPQVHEIIIINYELVHKRIDDLIELAPGTVIFDEAQALRNRSSQRYDACARLAAAAGARVALSGTPIYNNAPDIHSMVDALTPGALGTLGEFGGRYADPRSARLSERLRAWGMLRRLKADVAADLPPKTRTQNTVAVGAEYAQKLKDMYAGMEPSLLDRAGPQFNTAMLHMRTTERQVAGLAKAPFAAKYLQDFLADSADPLVVFCHHHAVHAILLDALRGYNPASIIGTQTYDERQKAIDGFQSGANRVIICSLRAGNVGISLTRASSVVFVELDWSPAVHRQAEDRLHRVGQQSPVSVYYLVGAGTFDETLVGALVTKTEQADGALGDPKEKLLALVRSK